MDESISFTHPEVGVRGVRGSRPGSGTGRHTSRDLWCTPSRRFSATNLEETPKFTLGSVGVFGASKKRDV